jgi:hypothetical protein
MLRSPDQIIDRADDATTGEVRLNIADLLPEVHNDPREMQSIFF